MPAASFGTRLALPGTMSRKPLIRSSHLPYHVTARTNNREEFPCELFRVWKILTAYCYEATILFGVEIHALVLMPNHFHLLITTPNEDLGRVMKQIMQSTTQALNLVTGRAGHIFGGPYRRTLVDSPIYFSHALKYVYRNPVKAEICTQVEDYRFSTLQGLLGESPLPFPIHFPFGKSEFVLIPSEIETFLGWSNTPFKKEHDEAIQKALKRKMFEPPKQGWKRSLESLKSELL